MIRGSTSTITPYTDGETRVVCGLRLGVWGTLLID